MELHGDKDAQGVRICNGLDNPIWSDSHDSQTRGKMAHNLF